MSGFLAVAAVTGQALDRSTSDGRLVLDGGVPHRGAQPSASPRQGQGPGSASAPVGNPYDAWAGEVAQTVGVPSRALAAYARTQQRLTDESPTCGLSWTTLAGIGYVESHNGDLGGGLRADGRPVEPIVGVALDGAADVAAIVDTDDGRLDGDVEHDRAVGPMQFIPTTWRTWAADGDRDGRRDPQDIDDAALAAGRYLCAAGSVASPETWTAAIYSYNHSDEYVAAVFAAADAFARRSNG